MKISDILKKAELFYKFCSEQDEEDEDFEEQIDSDSGDFLYHITYYNRLPSIVSSGLRPNQNRSIGGSAYTAHAQGRIFLTEKDGLSFWADRAEEFANHNSDDIVNDGLIPVVLRIDVNNIEKIELDEIGKTDAKVDAWMAHHGIPARYINVWTGTNWTTMSNYQNIDLMSAVSNVETEEDPAYDFVAKSPLTNI